MFVYMFNLINIVIQVAILVLSKVLNENFDTKQVVL
jgi:hypothetical protein